MKRVPAGELAASGAPPPGELPVRVLAVDDGHSETKCAWFDPAGGGLKVSSFPSRTIRGYEELDPSGRGAPNVYATYDEEQPADLDAHELMMVVERGRLSADKGEKPDAGLPDQRPQPGAGPPRAAHAAGGGRPISSSAPPCPIRTGMGPAGGATTP